MVRLVWGLGLAVLVGCETPCEEVLTLVPDPVVGGVIYQNNCRRCHGPAGLGDIGPDLNTRVPFLDRCGVASTVLNGAGEMPGFEGELELQEIADVTEYIWVNF